MAGLKVDKLDSLITRFYEAAVRPEIWRQVLNETSEALGADGAALFSDPLSPSLGLHWSDGADELVDWVYREGPALHNPRPERALQRGRPGKAITESELFNDWELTHLPFNVGMVDRIKLRWDAGGNVGNVSGKPVFLTAQRAAGKERFQRADLDALEALFPHVRRAAEVASAIGNAHANGMIDSMTAMDCPAILLDYAGRPCRLNARAEFLLNDALRIERGFLVAADRAANRNLQQVIGAALSPATLGKQDKIPFAALPRRGARALLVQGLPLAGSVGDVFRPCKAILVFKDPDAAVALEEQALRDMFGLTPAEARIATGIALGQELSTLATQLGIGVGTARVHLKAVMAKTSTHRQAELVALLVRLTSVRMNS